MPPATPSSIDAIPAPLTYESHHPDQTTTILLLHGAFSSPQEYHHVIPHLSSYHLLIPYLPSHGRPGSTSRTLTPLTLSLTSTSLSQLIQSYAKNQTAHVIGVSLGAHCALHLGSTYPSHVSSIFASGYNHFPAASPWLRPWIPYGVKLGKTLEDLVPAKLVSWLMDGADLDLKGTQTPGDLELIRNVVDILVGEDILGKVQARTLVVAATKRGIVPSNDNVEDARRVAAKLIELAREEDGDGDGVKEDELVQKYRAVQMRKMRHPWQLQAPELFANCVLAWIEAGNLPEDMEEL